MESTQTISIISNLNTFYEIALDSFKDAQKHLEASRILKPGGGYIITPDPERKSFKQSLIAIAFIGSYIDLYMRTAYIVQKGEPPPIKGGWDYKKNHEKLKWFGVSDKSLLELCMEFQKIRNDVAHEKPIVIGANQDISVGTAQDGAKIGFSFIEQLHGALPITLPSQLA